MSATVAGTRTGFFTDTTVCIGCKACEVACKEWNLIPEDGLVFTGESFDNTSELNGSTWRHVAFVEKEVRRDGEKALGWLMSSDVCKHCSEAGCLDVCPTGAIFRTEFGTVVIQDDVCNGCGYCIVACPFGVIGRRERNGAKTERFGIGAHDGGAHKCTLCYDRLRGGLEPACAKACPTDSIQFGPLDELIARAKQRCEQVREAGFEQARLYGADRDDGVGGFGAFFLLLDDPEVYGLPPAPTVPTRRLKQIWGAAAAAAGLLAAGVSIAFAGRAH